MILLEQSKNLRLMENSFWINPFIKIAGFRSLIYGLLGLLLIAVVAYLTGTHFYGFSDLGFAKDSEFWLYALEQLLSWVLISLCLYVSGLLFSNTKLRVVDVFGTNILARMPLLLVPLVRLIPPFQSFVFQSVEMYLLLGIYVLSLAWTMVLMFNGFKISSNLKGIRLIASFIISIVVAEILIRLILNSIYYL